MIESDSLWPLIEARAAATPDDRMAVDARDRSISFGDYHDTALRTGPADANGDGILLVNELVLGIGNGLNGCPAGPMPTTGTPAL